jgi:hypothetical protein
MNLTESFQAGRYPRERGYRPLNSNRSAAIASESRGHCSYHRFLLPAARARVGRRVSDDGVCNG